MQRWLASTGFSWVPGMNARGSQARLDEARFSDEEILTVIRAGEAGMKLPELCKVTGISQETYFDWKSRYSGLSAKQMRALRVRQRTRQQRVTVLAALVVAAAAGNVVLMLTRQPAAAFTPPTMASLVIPDDGTATDSGGYAVLAATMGSAPAVVATGATGATAATGVTGATGAPAANAAAARPTTPPNPAPAASPTVPTPSPTVTPTSAAKPTVTPAATAAPALSPWSDYVTADPNGVSVQVAAVPDLRQAQTALEKLTLAGYPAHMTTKTVNGSEMYRVRVGPLRSRDAADLVVSRLKKDGYGSPWITK